MALQPVFIFHPVYSIKKFQHSLANVYRADTGFIWTNLTPAKGGKSSWHGGHYGKAAAAAPLAISFAFMRPAKIQIARAAAPDKACKGDRLSHVSKSHAELNAELADPGAIGSEFWSVRDRCAAFQTNITATRFGRGQWQGCFSSPRAANAVAAAHTTAAPAMARTPPLSLDSPHDATSAFAFRRLAKTESILELIWPFVTKSLIMPPSCLPSCPCPSTSLSALLNLPAVSSRPCSHTPIGDTCVRLMMMTHKQTVNQQNMT